MNLTASEHLPAHWPSIAVVIPNHERIDGLLRALASVSAQEYPGPVRTYLVFRQRDAISALLETMTSCVVPVPVSGHERGNPIALKRNLGLAAATEDLIAFLDDDDLWHPLKLRFQVEALQGSPGTVAVSTRVTTFASSPRFGMLTTRPRMEMISRYRVLRTGAIATSSMLGRTAHLKRMRFDERPEWRGVEDFELWIRLMEAGSIGRVDAVLTALAVVGSSQSRGDRCNQRAAALSVLAASTGPGTATWVTRAAAVELAAATALAGTGRPTAEAQERLMEALDGRLFGRCDPLVSRLVMKSWRSPLLASTVRGAAARLRARAAAIR